ncbi:RNA methyltransferase [Desulforhabdus amnigena]|jgi:tRNA/rRNA methyltransferase|uniref:tRNA (cytidine/uridine-2'-O-)-methyltransferase TrmJ n=1 Tax=Desulforhabdus amnigena TaxID=40218 RepID=A0A9W6FRE3_9BACT|nr:RNA methyltransferase [Desulforhabdus amnigena]NLJ28445.1 RNA methyltransferase [Deltaproteobacteria bacterium]GLI33467.1 tRNA (cytidine/uridine-2'-O-)-methyltransferase TrmJ [Desulforhabdus amnigena]
MKVNLKNIAIVLHEPHFPENIGAAARAAKNMGIRRLVVVNPLDCDLTRILRMATHTAEDVVADMEVYNEIEEALAPYRYVVGTTARTGSHRQGIKTPRRIAQELVPISEDNEIAILFGTESRGLTNQELRYCDALVTIPTADFSSLNLAQAVMVIAYELFTATQEEPQNFVPRLANRHELEGMYDHLTKTLAKINFINPENPEYWMTSVRKAFSRIGLRARDVKIIRGICRQIDWYVSQNRDSEIVQPTHAAFPMDE